ncbi:MAG: AAA family ATPase [Gammaproteobacteria bacterium]
MAERRTGEILVLAGTNGAGKSSIGGEALRRGGADYLNPDEITRQLLAANPGLSGDDANALAWTEGKRRLELAVATRSNFAFETTLGGRTITALLHKACDAGIPVRIWYCALASAELHIARVRARVKKGGHDIPIGKIRQRYDDSREHLIDLLPRLTELYVYDNSADAPGDARPTPTLILHMQDRKIVRVAPLPVTPDWAKPIVMTALNLSK